MLTRYFNQIKGKMHKPAQIDRLVIQSRGMKLDWDHMVTQSDLRNFYMDQSKLYGLDRARYLVELENFQKTLNETETVGKDTSRA